MRTIAFSVSDPARPSPAGHASPAALHATLAGLVSRSLSTQHASMLATPLVGADGRVDWCTGLPGEVVSPSELNPTDRAALRQRADALLADLRRLQARLNAEGPASRATARLLTQALDLEMDACLHAVGGQPVLAPWGITPRVSAAPAAAVAPQAMAPQPETNTPTGIAHPPAPSEPIQAAALPSIRRGGLHAVVSLLLLLAGGGALAAVLHARQPADAAIAARIEALTRGNADLGKGLERKRSEKCGRLP